MPKCGGNIELTEDSSTLEDLESEDCVSFEETKEENSCSNCESVATSCTNARNMISQRKKVFLKDPVRILFGRTATRSQTAKLRELLKSKCNIDASEEPVELLKQVHTYSGIEINRFTTKIRAKMNLLDLRKYDKYIAFLTKTLRTADHWNSLIDKHDIEDEDVLKQTMKNDLLTFETELKISNIGFAHQPRNVLEGAYSFLLNASEAPYTKMSLAFKLLAENQACYEGVLSMAEEVFY